MTLDEMPLRVGALLQPLDVHALHVPSPARSGERVRVRGCATSAERPLTLTLSPPR
jgi:phosphatidylserine decarboxylase